MPEDKPDRVPEDMPEHIAEDMPGRMPEDMPDRMPEDMPDKMPEDMPDRMPEDLPVTKRINVMVGITRSKVINFCFAENSSFCYFYNYRTWSNLFLIEFYTGWTPKLHENFQPPS